MKHNLYYMYKILRKFIKYVLIFLYETVIPCKLAPMNLDISLSLCPNF